MHERGHITWQWITTGTLSLAVASGGYWVSQKDIKQSELEKEMKAAVAAEASMTGSVQVIDQRMKRVEEDVRDIKVNQEKFQDEMRRLLRRNPFP